jgi:hypothetical protein
VTKGIKNINKKCQRDGKKDTFITWVYNFSHRKQNSGQPRQHAEKVEEILVNKWQQINGNLIFFFLPEPLNLTSEAYTYPR